MTPQEKEQALAVLAQRLDEQRAQLAAIEPRLLEYFEGLANEPDVHNGYEILCGVKLLRLMRTYEVDTDEVQKTIHVFEGNWSRDAKGIWRHQSGGVRQPGRQGPEVYRFEPFQVFVFTAVYGVKGWIDTELTTADRYPTQTERVTDDNRIEDLRRMCVRFICFMPRKTNKTGLAALIGCHDFMLGDDDAMAVCCANSQDQSKILYKRLQQLIGQFDPQGRRIRSTATETNWRPGQMRSASAYAMSAGGKTKDGLFASLCLADEYGSAGYTNGNSDMGNLVKVIESSMGPRREGLTFITTTAGNIQQGPFVELLDATRIGLMMELKYDTGEEVPSVANDRWMCLLLQPDDWETDEDVIFTERNLRRKVNPMLGKIVQHAFYEQAIADSMLDPITKQETITKLFNVYRTHTATEWIKPEVVRALQNELTIDAYTKQGGWVIFTGLDFSQGDDLHTAGYLAARKHHSGHGYELFADFDAWIKQDVLERSSIRPLYEEWIQKGWLHVSPGAVFQPSLFVKRFDELLSKGCQFQYFGYDPYQSKDPINTLKAYLQEKGVAQPDKYVIPVSQRNAWFNAPTDDLARAIKSPIPYITFSANPMWPWLFGNCVLSIEGKDMDLSNKKPVKRSQSDSCKVDPIQCITMGLGLMTQYESQNH